MVKFSGLTISEFINQYKVTFFSAKNISKFLPVPSPNGSCVLPFDFVLERVPKNISYGECDIECFLILVLNFLYHLINMNIHIESFGL